MRKGQFGDVAGSPEMTQTFDEISQGLTDVGVQLNQPVSYPYAAAETAVEMQPLAKVRKPRAKKPAVGAPVAKPVARKNAKVKPAASKPAAKPVARARKSAKTDA